MSRRIVLRFGSTRLFARAKLMLKAPQLCNFVKHRLEPILIEGIHIQGR